MLTRALWRSPVPLAGGGGSDLGAGLDLGADLGADLGLGAGLGGGSGASRLGPASFSSEMVGSAPPLRASGSSSLSNVLRRYPWLISLPWTDAVANLCGGEGWVLALKISMFPHDLSVSDGVSTRRRRLELSLVHRIVDQPSGLECLNIFFSHGCGKPVLVNADAEQLLAIRLRVIGP